MARTFNGSQYLFGDGVPVSGPPMTIACWVRSTSDSTQQYVVVLRDTVSPLNGFFGIRLVGNAAGDPVNAVAIGAGAALSNGGSYPTNTWFHVAAVFASDSSRLVYLNGTPGTLNTTSLTTTSIGWTFLGHDGSILGLVGDLAEVSVHAAALDGSEIAELFSGGAGGIGKSASLVRSSDLAAYWKLLAGDGCIDYSGNGFNLTDSFSLPDAGTHPPIDYGSSGGSPLLALMQQYSLSGGLL